MQREVRIAMLLAELKKTPGDIFFNYALGLEYAAGEMPLAGAEEQFLRVIALAPEYIPAYYQLGKLLELKGEVERALACYKKGHMISKNTGDRKSAAEFEEAIFLLEE